MLFRCLKMHLKSIAQPRRGVRGALSLCTRWEGRAALMETTFCSPSGQRGCKCCLLIITAISVQRAPAKGVFPDALADVGVQFGSWNLGEDKLQH